MSIVCQYLNCMSIFKLNCMSIFKTCQELYTWQVYKFKMKKFIFHLKVMMRHTVFLNSFRVTWAKKFEITGVVGRAGALELDGLELKS